MFCRALFLIIAIGNVTFFFFFWDYTTNLLKPSELKMKKTRFNGHLRVFCQEEYITIILSNVSTFPFVAIYMRLYFCHDALLITEWQSYLASRHIKQRFFRSGSQIWYHVTCNFLFFLNCDGMTPFSAPIVPTSFSFFSHNLSAKVVRVEKILCSNTASLVLKTFHQFQYNIYSNVLILFTLFKFSSNVKLHPTEVRCVHASRNFWYFAVSLYMYSQNGQLTLNAYNISSTHVWLLASMALSMFFF